MKKLIADPWSNVNEKYNVGDTVTGTILKVNPFGFFVELDPDIHGLAHVSELSDKPVDDVSTLGEAGQKMEFKIVSIEAKEHRLGLSLKALKAPAAPAKEEKAEETAETAEAPAEEAPAAEAPAEENTAEAQAE